MCLKEILLSDRVKVNQRFSCLYTALMWPGCLLTPILRSPVYDSDEFRSRTQPVKEIVMDIVFLAVLAGLSLLSGGLIAGCNRLEKK